MRHVRGVLFLDYVRMLRSQKAVDWSTHLPPEDLTYLSTKIEPDAWYHLGYAYKEKGKKKDAVRSFREYLSRKPDAQDRKEIEDEITFLE